MTDRYKPTARLRWVERAVSLDAENANIEPILQQWFGPDMPSYMADPTVGEWRDIPLDIE